MPDFIEPDTGEFKAAQLNPGAAAPAPLSSQVRVDLAALSDVGCVRSENEDHYLVVRVQRVMQTLLTNLPAGVVPERFEEAGYAMVVADGLGGSAAGEIASQVAIRTLVNLALHTPDWMMRPGEREVFEILERMSERFRKADDLLKEEARGNPAWSGMATTLTLACSLARDLILAHVGDSRVYLFRQGDLRQLTYDDTLAEELVKRGTLRPDQAATHRLRHVLTQALGAGNLVEAQLQRYTLESDDQLLLCTDGLTNMVGNASIAAILSGAASAEEACRSLVELAKKNGGNDNITVIVARYRFPQET